VAPLAVTLTPLDLGALVLCVLFAVRGALRGFAWQVVRLVALGAALWGASALYRPLGERFQAWFPALSPSAAPFVAWGAVFVVLLVVGALLASRVRGAVDGIELTLPDRLAGLALGAATGVAFCALALFVGGAMLDALGQRRVLEDMLRGASAPTVLGQVADALAPLLPDGARGILADARRTVAGG
jgi:uncharacterized membrane protein required for colicin V production